MNATIILLASGSILALSIILGKHLPIILPEWHKMLDRKPFNCRPCFTFHTLWIGIGVLAWLIDSVPLFIGGIILAFIVFFIVKHIDNKQITK